MPAPDFKTKLQLLEKEKLASLQREWPELTEQLSLSISASKSASPDIASENKPLLEEEYQQLLQLIRAQAALPPQAISVDQRDLFETAMSDWLGFSVTLSPTSSGQIPYHSGKIRALQYPSGAIRRFVPDAGVGKSTLTWTSPGESIDLEHLLFLHPKFLIDQPGGITARPWFVGKTAVVVDPITLATTIAQIADVLPEQTSRYQFGATPGLMRQNTFWHTDNLGIVLVFYTDESIMPGTQFTRSNA